MFKNARKILTFVLILAMTLSSTALAQTSIVKESVGAGVFRPSQIDFKLHGLKSENGCSDEYKGIDISTAYGATVMASDGGVVTFAGWSGSYGNTVIIDHGDGCTTRYAHNSELLVEAGQYVSQYEAIALLGSSGNSTGPHVHFEIMFDGVTVNPADYINF